MIYIYLYILGEYYLVLYLIIRMGIILQFLHMIHFLVYDIPTYNMLKL